MNKAVKAAALIGTGFLLLVFLDASFGAVGGFIVFYVGVVLCAMGGTMMRSGTFFDYEED